MAKKNVKEVKEEVKEVSVETPVEVVEGAAPISVSLNTQEFLNKNKEELFKEVPDLVTAEFYENPPRIMLVVTKALKVLPTKEYDGLKISFDQMVLGGVVAQKDLSPANLKNFSNEAKDVVKEDQLQNTLGKEVLGPHNVKTNNKTALEQWKKRNSRVKVVE
jgi:hypothetical protein